MVHVHQAARYLDFVQLMDGSRLVLTDFGR